MGPVVIETADLCDRHHGVMWALRWVGGVLWAGSWYLMYLEITRWHHVTPSLRFNAGPRSDTGGQPRPGRPLKLLAVVAAIAPLVVMGSFVLDRASVRGSSCELAFRLARGPVARLITGRSGPGGMIQRQMTGHRVLENLPIE